VYIGDSDARVRHEVEESLHNFVAYNASPAATLPDEESKAKLRAKGCQVIPACTERTPELKMLQA
jgi:hypothetical protein